MKQVLEWSAKRAGDSITVQGTDPDGAAVKITHIAEIKADAGGVVAVNDKGVAHQLVIGGE